MCWNVTSPSLKNNNKIHYVYYLFHGTEGGGIVGTFQCYLNNMFPSVADTIRLRVVLSITYLYNKKREVVEREVEMPVEPREPDDSDRKISILTDYHTLYDPQKWSPGLMQEQQKGSKAQDSFSFKDLMLFASGVTMTLVVLVVNKVRRAVKRSS